MSKQITLIDISCDIAAHLKRFAEDPSVNAPVPMASDPATAHSPFMSPSACRIRGGVSVTYDTICGAYRLTRAEAETYLAWLDAGNVGRHFDMAKSSEIAKVKAAPVPMANGMMASENAVIVDDLAFLAEKAEDDALLYMDIPCADDKRSTLLGTRNGLRIALLQLEDIDLPQCAVHSSRTKNQCRRRVHTGRHFDIRFNGWNVEVPS